MTMWDVNVKTNPGRRKKMIVPAEFLAVARFAEEADEHEEEGDACYDGEGDDDAGAVGFFWFGAVHCWVGALGVCMGEVEVGDG